MNLPWNRQHGITLQLIVTLTNQSDRVRLRGSWDYLRPRAYSPHQFRETIRHVSDFLSKASVQTPDHSFAAHIRFLKSFVRSISVSSHASSLGSGLPLPVTLSNERQK